jgi:hypothetical protein
VRSQRSVPRLLGLLLFAYFASYLWFRSTHTEVWQRDGQSYVIFPATASMLYLLWRPLTYVDGAATGMQFHIGPHQ